MRAVGEDRKPPYGQWPRLTPLTRTLHMVLSWSNLEVVTPRDIGAAASIAHTLVHDGPSLVVLDAFGTTPLDIEALRKRLA